MIRFIAPKSGPAVGILLARWSPSLYARLRQEVVWRRRLSEMSEREFGPLDEDGFVYAALPLTAPTGAAEMASVGIAVYSEADLRRLPVVACGSEAHKCLGVSGPVPSVYVRSAGGKVLMLPAIGHWKLKTRAAASKAFREVVQFPA